MDQARLRILTSLMIPIFLLGCGSGTASVPGAGGPEGPISSTISLSNVSNGTCLNLQQLMQIMQDPRFGYPSTKVTTNFLTETPMSESEIDYYSAAAFSYEAQPANQIQLFNGATQPDCQNIKTLSASGETLSFKIIEASSQHLRFQLTDSFGEAVSATTAAALYSRDQPFDYTLDLVSGTNLTITKIYSTIDVLCGTSVPQVFVLTEALTWANDSGGLPLNYQIDPSYLGKVTAAQPTAVMGDSDTSSTAVPAGLLSIATIEKIMATPVSASNEICH